MPRHIPDDVLDQIRARADIVEVVQTYVPTLKHAGAAWKACCPFHQEKTPSFTVNAQRQSYKCFGCGKGGNVFTFVMEMEKLDFPNAAEFLARKYGVVIPEDDSYRRGRGREFQKDKTESDYNLRERLYTLHEKLAAWYAKNLADGTSAPAVSEYFKTRGIPVDFTNRFQIGASPDSWDSAINFAHKNGFTDEELTLAGIVSKKDEKSTHIYDRFRNRLMFPIWNEQGRIVAFSARTVEKDPKMGKYVNSPESPVFKKSRTLYALHFARVPIAEKKYAILCEGQLDVIAMHRAGCDNAVAAQGTAFGIEHARILKRYTAEIRLALDNDQAGRKAVFADAEILLPLGFTLKVVTWPNAKDADEVLKGQGAETIQKAVADSVDFFEFAFRVASEKYDAASPDGKAHIASDVLDRIQKLDSASARDAYVEWLAGKLSLTSGALRGDLEKRMKQQTARRNYDRTTEPEPVAKPVPVPAKKPFSERSRGLHDAFVELLKLVLADEEFAKSAAHDVAEGVCDDTPVGRALDLAMAFALSGEWENVSDRILTELAKDGCDVDLISGIITSISEPEPEKNESAKPEENALSEPPKEFQLDFTADSEEVIDERQIRKRIYDDCVRKIRLEYCRFRLEELSAEAEQLSDDDPEKLMLIREITEWSRQLRQQAKNH